MATNSLNIGHKGQEQGDRSRRLEVEQLEFMLSAYAAKHILQKTDDDEILKMTLTFLPQ